MQKYGCNTSALLHTLYNIYTTTYFFLLLSKEKVLQVLYSM